MEDTNEANKAPAPPQYRLTKEQAERLEKSIAASVKKWQSIKVQNIGALKSKKNADGTFTNTMKLDFGNSFFNVLRMYILQLLNTGKLPPEQRDELLYNASILEGLLAELKVYTKRERAGGKTGVKLDLTPADPKVNETPEAHAKWLQEVTAALESPPIKSIIGYLLTKTGGSPPEQPQKGEGIASANEILYSMPAIQQNFNTAEAREKQQQRLPMTVAEGWQSTGGILLEKSINSYGVDLNERQQNVLKAILGAFTATDYKGNTERLPLEERIPKLREEPEKVTSTFKVLQNGNAKPLPQIRMTQAELFKLCGIDHEDQSARQNALADLAFLGSEQFVFWWQRYEKKPTTIRVKYGRGTREKTEMQLVRDEETKEAKKEDVYEVGTLLRVKYVRDEETQELKYYEIAPSLVMLEHQNSGGFVRYPYKLEREVQKMTGKRLNKYEAQLLLWLAWQFEKERQHRHSLKRQGNEVGLAKKGGEIPAEISIDWQALAVELKMPESLRIKNKKKGYKMIEKACVMAVKARFLTNYEIDGTGTVNFRFNAAAYNLPDRQRKMLEDAEMS